MRCFQILLPAVFLVFVMIFNGCGSQTAVTSVTPTFNMGERAQTGPLIYNVFDTKWYTQLGTGLTARIPTQRFFVVHLSIVNSGSGETSVPALSITDDGGQIYPELSNGDQVPQWLGYLRRIKPAETLLGNVVFDAPPRHYKLNIADELEEKKAFVDIPLSFSSEAPNDTYVPDKPKTDK